MSPYFRNLRAKIGHELLLIPSVAAVIHDESGALLLQRKAEHVWSLPAGAIEPGESPEDAVRREVREETGLLVEPTELRGVFGGSEFRLVYPNCDIVEYTVVLFRCKVAGATSAPLDPETQALQYFSRSKCQRLGFLIQPTRYSEKIETVPGDC